jgi:hypothetical protein
LSGVLLKGRILPFTYFFQNIRKKAVILIINFYNPCKKVYFWLPNDYAKEDAKAVQGALFSL